MHVAREIGREQDLRKAMERLVIAAVGPVTEAAIIKQDLKPEIIPEKHKMGHLVKAIAEQGPASVTAKRLK